MTAKGVYFGTSSKKKRVKLSLGFCGVALLIFATLPVAAEPTDYGFQNNAIHTMGVMKP